MDKNREKTIVIGMVALIVVVILGGLALLFFILFGMPMVGTVITVAPPTPLNTATPTAVAEKQVAHTPTFDAPEPNGIHLPTPTNLPTASPSPAPLFPAYDCPIEPLPTAPSTPLGDLSIFYTGDDGIYRWQEVTGQSELIFPATNEINGLQISDDGQYIVFVQTVDAATERRSLWVVDSDGENGRLLLSEVDFKQLHDEPENFVVRPLQISWVPHSHLLAFSTVRYKIVDGGIEGITAYMYDDLHLLNTDSGEITTLLSPREGGDFFFAPHGEQVAIVNDSSLSLLSRDGNSQQRDLLTWEPLGITHDSYRPTAVWLPDSTGFLIAISNATDNMDAFYNPEATSTVWRVPADGTPPQQLTTLVGAPLGASFSPDRSQALFERVDATNIEHELHVVAAANAWNVVYAEGQGVYSQGWLPDGSGFVFRTNRDGPLLGRLCQPPTPLPLPETPDSFVRNIAWLDPSRFLFTIDEPPQLLLGDLNGMAEPIGTLRPEYFFSVGALRAFDFHLQERSSP